MSPEKPGLPLSPASQVLFEFTRSGYHYIIHEAREVVVARFSGEENSTYTHADCLRVLAGSRFHPGDRLQITRRVADPSLDLYHPENCWMSISFAEGEVHVCFLTPPTRDYRENLLRTEFLTCTRSRGNLTGIIEVLGYGTGAPQVVLFGTRYPAPLGSSVIQWLLAHHVEYDLQFEPGAYVPPNVGTRCRGCAFFWPPREAESNVCTRVPLRPASAFVERLEMLPELPTCHIARETFETEVVMGASQQP